MVKVVDHQNEQKLQRLRVLQVDFEHFLSLIEFEGELGCDKPSEEFLRSQEVSAHEREERGRTGEDILVSRCTR
jgi:hypothetical protein